MRSGRSAGNVSDTVEDHHHHHHAGAGASRPEVQEALPGPITFEDTSWIRLLILRDVREFLWSCYFVLSIHPTVFVVGRRPELTSSDGLAFGGRLAQSFFFREEVFS